MTRIINKSHKREANTDGVYVGRPGKYGNPYVVKDVGRGNALYQYKLWIVEQPELIEDMRKELRGKNLICWCAPQPCHAEIIRALANETDERYLQNVLSQANSYLFDAELAPDEATKRIYLDRAEDCIDGLVRRHD